MTSVGELEKERDRLKGELSRVRLQLMALESVLSTNEHLVLKSPAFNVWHLDRPMPWGPSYPELWHVRLEIRRSPVNGRGEWRSEVVEQSFNSPMRVPEFPVVMFALLPEPRKV